MNIGRRGLLILVYELGLLLFASDKTQLRMTLTRKGLIFFLHNPESGISSWTPFSGSGMSERASLPFCQASRHVCYLMVEI